MTAVDWAEARRVSFDAASVLPPESVPLRRATGRRLAAEVLALCNVPHYASSAMDGWAVAGDGPWQLIDAHERGETVALRPGVAATIVTGGLIPVGADGVLRSEHGRVEERMLARNERADPDEPRPGQHIRPAGEEARASDLVIPAGILLNPAHIAVAAGCGHDELLVARTPRVGLVLTGDEVVEAGIPAAGFVRDSFGVQLPAFVAMLGGSVLRSERLPDDLDLLVDALAGSAAEVIVTTGGTGPSGVDYLHAALEQLGAHLLIDGVKMRPGGPSLLARLPDGRFVVGLPGNPLAAMMGMLTLVHPLLAGLQGQPAPALGSVRLASAVPGRPDRTTLAPFTLVDGAAVPSRWRGSGMLRGLADAAGVLVCPPDGAEPGSNITTLPLPWR